jgi:hypothetical protein
MSSHATYIHAQSPNCTALRRASTGRGRQVSTYLPESQWSNLGTGFGGILSWLLVSHHVCTMDYSESEPISRDTSHTSNRILQDSLDIRIFGHGTPRVSQMAWPKMGASSMTSPQKQNNGDIQIDKSTIA